jgi:UPF0716 protein FxsA
MAWVIPLLFLGWPAIEIAVFVEVARWVGWLGAIAGIVLSGMVGIAFLRVQGVAAAHRAQVQLGRGEMPVRELFDGACLAAAGLLFFLPGFVSDLVAIVLLLPPVRMLLRRHLAGRLRTATDIPAGTVTIIEGDWQVVTEPDEPNPKPPSRELPG